MRIAVPTVVLALFSTLAVAAGLGAPGLVAPGPPEPGARVHVAPPGPAVAPPAEENCGIDTDLVPDFALVDQNPNSPTYGQTYSRDDMLGQVLVFYWAQAT